MRTAIVTDSNSGITPEESRATGIFVIPMPVIIGGDTFFEAENITTDEFYQRLKSGEPISTSQPSPGSVMGLWEELLSSGYDEIVHIPMSSGLSCSCQVATQMAQDFSGKVQVVDNHRISVTLRQSVENALAMAKKGMSAAQIKQALEKDAFDSVIYVAVETLEYLKRGGRITSAAATIATVLNIKPILIVQGEKLDAFKKCRGMKKCREEMLDAFENDLNTRFADWPREEVRIALAGSFLREEDRDEWIKTAQERFPGYKSVYNPLSISIGCHVGYDACGIGISRAIN